jgi:hypothetical protein
MLLPFIVYCIFDCYGRFKVAYYVMMYVGIGRFDSEADPMLLDSCYHTSARYQELSSR